MRTLIALAVVATVANCGYVEENRTELRAAAAAGATILRPVVKGLACHVLEDSSDWITRAAGDAGVC